MQQEFYLIQDFAPCIASQGFDARMAAMQNERESCRAKPLESSFSGALR
jgi:hypothetical protein